MLVMLHVSSFTDLLIDLRQPDYCSFDSWLKEGMSDTLTGRYPVDMGLVQVGTVCSQVGRLCFCLSRKGYGSILWL